MNANTPQASVTHSELANAIRALAMDAVEKAKSGHPGMPMGMADVATVLFTRFLKFDAKTPRWADRDRFVLSAGHGSMLLYALAYLTGFEDIDIEQIKNFRVRGSSGKVNIALSGLPDFTCLPGESPLHKGAISISPSIDYIERAYDEAKYGQFSTNPYIDMIIPSMIDRDMAPPGHHVMSCFVQYAPYDIEGGWDDAKHEELGEAVISTIEQYAPNIRKAIVGMQVISPKDIETIAGITGGNIFHGELLLHQIFFLRPAPQWADFRTPLRGYYFGAAGAHPGGGVMGAAGMLAAKEILKDWK